MVKHLALIAVTTCLLLTEPTCPPLKAQPPEQTLDSVLQEFAKLRNQSELLEITGPREAIAVYMQFYQSKGQRYTASSIIISSRIAQIYSRELGDHAKALEIYDWAIQKYGSADEAGRLVKERAQLVDKDFGAVLPIVIGPAEKEFQNVAIRQVEVKLSSKRINSDTSILPVLLAPKTGQAKGTAIPLVIPKEESRVGQDRKDKAIAGSNKTKDEQAQQSSPK